MPASVAEVEELNLLSADIIGAAIEVHRYLGPGLLESTYQKCLETELMLRGIAFRSELAVPVRYKGRSLDCAYRIDLIVEQRVAVELKAVERFDPIHSAQVLTYLRLLDLRLGLLINFNVPTLAKGIRRLANQL